MFRGVWEAVKTKAKKIRVAEAEGGGKEGRRRKKARKEGAKERKRNQKRKPKKKRMIKIKKIAEEWEI